MAKEKVQNKIQTIQGPNKKYKIKYRQPNDQPVLYFVLFLWSLGCLYFILYFFFGHWIACTLFCTFSLVIGTVTETTHDSTQTRCEWSLHRRLQS
jgi:uncharacterized membrane protein YjjP (DUF1212 family)